MSLLLDARKKSQGGSDSRPLELSLEPAASASTPSYNTPKESARSASQNLFQAKSAAPSGGHVNRNLLYALLGSIVLFCLGAFYVWYEINSMSRPAVVRPAAQPIAAITPPPAPIPVMEAAPAPVERLVPEIAPAPIAQAPTPEIPAAPAIAPKVSAPVHHKAVNSASATTTAKRAKAITVLRDPTDSLDMQLNNAYQAYQAGRFEQAQYLYKGVLAQEPSNVDSLLGLAAIAQQAGADPQARQYYARVLVLEPRNAVANAGMSALVTDDNRESRLKMLINEQKNSSSLHFALANYYAEQQRWAEAQQSYFNAYQLEPNNATLAFNLAISLERLGQRKPAAQYYRRALSLDTGKSAGFDHKVIEQHAQTLAQ
ncbi:MAG: tetratricopeptide repeat protein [Gallionella sp.]